MKQPSPPKLAAYLLNLFLRGEAREAIAGDLEEEYRSEILPSLGPGGARRWYWKQVIASIASRIIKQPRRNRSPRRKGDSVMRTLIYDLRFAARLLARKPGFTAVVVLTLALGIGANTAIFSVVNGVLLRPLPYRNPDEIVVLFGRHVERGARKLQISPADFFDYRDQNQSFEHLCATYDWAPTLSGEQEPARLKGTLVSYDLFALMGFEPVLGRAFLKEEDKQSGERVVVISHSLWQGRFGSDPNILGRQVTLNGFAYAVIGVMPAGFGFPNGTEVWRPLRMDPDPQTRGSRMLGAVARLKPGVTIEQAQADMNTITDRLAQEYPEQDAGRSTFLVPMHEEVVGKSRLALLVLLGAVAFVLLIACANVASLLLARAKSREKEIAVRTALGARRGQIVKQLLTESILLALVGGAAGLILATWGVRLLVALSPEDIPRLAEVSIDRRVLGFTFAITLVTGLVFGLFPALRSSRADLNKVLKEGIKGSSLGSLGLRARSLLVISEIALALTLMIGAGLLLKSFAVLLRVDPGFNPSQVLTFDLSPRGKSYSEEHQVVAMYEQLIERIQKLPGVVSAGAALSRPLKSQNEFGTIFTIDGRPPVALQDRPRTRINGITPDYFQTMAIPLLRGREFTARDDATAPAVAMINDAFARRFFPGEDPVGKQVRHGMFTDELKPVEIVGVVGDVKWEGLNLEAQPELFLPHKQSAFYDLDLVIRTANDPLNLVAAVRSEVWAIDKNLPPFNFTTMEKIVSQSVGQPRFNMILIGTFAAISMILAAIGIYGVMAYAVNQRTHEIGIRMALGAESSDVLRLVVGQGMALASVGVAAGLVAALAVTRVMSSLLFEVKSTDPTTFALTSLLLVSVALLACYIPARRASKVDPMVALRYE